MTSKEAHVAAALASLMGSWLTAAQAMRAELEQLTALTKAAADFGPASPVAEAAAAAYRVSTEQRAAAMQFHAKAAEELLQALEELRREGSH